MFSPSAATQQAVAVAVGVLTPALVRVISFRATLLLDGKDSGGSSLVCLLRQGCPSSGTALAMGLITGPRSRWSELIPAAVAAAATKVATRPFLVRMSSCAKNKKGGEVRDARRGHSSAHNKQQQLGRDFCLTTKHSPPNNTGRHPYANKVIDHNLPPPFCRPFFCGRKGRRWSRVPPTGSLRRRRPKDACRWNFKFRLLSIFQQKPAGSTPARQMLSV